MKEGLKNISARYPLFFRLVVFQVVAMVLSGAVLLFVYQHISAHYFTRSVEEQKTNMHARLNLVQEQWRTWKYMSLDEALNPAIEQFKNDYNLETLNVLDIKDLPKKHSRYHIIIPEATDPVINYVVYAKLSEKNIGYLNDMHHLFVVVMGAFFILLLVIIFVSSRFMFKWFYQPIGELNEAVTSMNAGDRLKIEHIKAAGAVGSFVSHFKQLTYFIRGFERMSSIGKMASQISCVLVPYLKELKDLLNENVINNEKDRQKMKRAVKGIENIINDLRQKSRKVNESLDSLQKQEGDYLKTQETFTTQLLFSLVETIMAEKRMQYHSLSNLRLDLVPAKSSYGMFVKVKTLQFRKLISNIIDLFAESSFVRENIMVRLDGCYQTVKITISDNVSVNFDNLYLQRKIPGPNFMIHFDKQKKLEKARQVVHEWGGVMQLELIEDRSVLISIELPRVPQQNWLLTHLALERFSLVVVVDEDKSIHGSWEEILSKADVKTGNVIHFYKPEEFVNWFLHERKHHELRSGYDTLLIAHEFSTSDKKGLDVIEELNLKSRSILVTSQYKQSRMRSLAENLKVKILPKPLVGVVPIIVSDIVEKPDCILIADDEHIQVYWRMEARLSGKIILTYKGPEDFYRDIHNYDRSVPVYLTTSLAGNVRGVDFALELNKLGFKNIYITTGRDKSQFPSMPWVKGIVNKEPPWKYH